MNVTATPLTCASCGRTVYVQATQPPLPLGWQRDLFGGATCPECSNPAPVVQDGEG